MGILFAVPSFIVGPLVYDAMHKGPSEYLIPAAGIQEESGRMQVRDRLASPLEKKAEKGTHYELSVGLAGLTAGVGVFLFVVIATCLTAEVAWWIRDGFAGHRTLEAPPQSEYASDYVTSVLGYGDEKQEDFEPQVDDYRAWEDPIQDEPVPRTVGL